MLRPADYHCPNLDQQKLVIDPMLDIRLKGPKLPEADDDDGKDPDEPTEAIDV